MKLALLLFLLLSLPCAAQDANVIVLSDANAQIAQRLHKRQVALDAEWEELKYRIVHDHLEAPNSQVSGCVVNRMMVLAGWGCAEYKFDPTFRFIVPQSTLTSSPSYDAPVFELVNGSAVPLKGKPDLEEDASGWHWVWNNTRNSELYPEDAHKFKEQK